MNQLEKLQEDVAKAVIQLVWDNSSAERGRLINAIVPDVSENIWKVYEKSVARFQQSFPPSLYGSMNAASRIDYAERFKQKIIEGLESSQICEAHTADRIYAQLETRKIAEYVINRVVSAKATHQTPDVDNELDKLKIMLPENKYHLLVKHLLALGSRYFDNKGLLDTFYVASAKSVAEGWLKKNRGYISLVEDRASTHSIPLDLEGSVPDLEQVHEMLMSHLVSLLTGQDAPSERVSSKWGDTDFSRLMADNMFKGWLDQKLAEEMPQKIRGKGF